MTGAVGDLYPKLDWAPRFLRAKTTLQGVARTSAACPLTGEIWIAGAGRFRRTRMLESIGCGVDGATPEWLATHVAEIGDMTGAREFTGAEAAFADLFRDARADAPRGERS